MPAPFDERYQLRIWPPVTFDRALWDAAFGSVADRLTAREELEASFESLIAQGTQASLDYIQATIAPQIASLQTAIANAEAEVADIIASGVAPDAAKLGGQLPSWYAPLISPHFTNLPTAPTAALGTATGQLATTLFVKNEIDAVKGGASAALDTLKELEDALGNEDSAIAALATVVATKANVIDYAGKNGTVRNTVLHGDNANGSPSFLTIGSGLTPAFTAANPLVLSFADGFGANGAKDALSRLTAGASLVAIAASCISYLAAAYVDAANVAWSATKAPPQYGPVYNQLAQTSLKLNNNALDDFGSAWTASLTYSNSSPAIAGSYCALFNGSSNYVTNLNWTTFYPPNSGGGFSARGFFKFTSFAALNSIFNAYNPVGFGLNLYTTTGGKVAVQLSSTGTSWDIANNTAGTTTLSTGTFYYIEITQDPVSGKYFICINGALDQTISNGARVCPCVSFAVGRQWTGSAFGNYMSGAAQAIEIMPYCDHPNGVSYTVPSSLQNVAAAGYASDWYDTVAQQMKSVSVASGVSGTNPTFATSKKVYVGEAQAGASTVSSVTAYAFNQTGKNGTGLLNAFGYGQGYKDLTATSALNTRYVNTGPKPKAVSIQVGVASGAETIFAYVAQPGGPDKIASRASAWAGYSMANLYAIVPPGCSLRVAANAGTWSMVYWGELDVL